MTKFKSTPYSFLGHICTSTSFSLSKFIFFKSLLHVKIIVLDLLSLTKLEFIGIFKFVSITILIGFLVEGGATLNDSLFRNNLVDKVKIFMAPKIIGGKDAPSFVSGCGIERLSEATKLEIKNTTMIDSDILIEADVIK